MKKKYLSTGVILFALILTACNNSEKSATKDISQNDKYLGIWQQTGYGQYLDISRDKVVRYEASTESCLKTHTFLRNEFPTLLGLKVVNIDSDTIHAQGAHDSNLKATLERISLLPESCSISLNNTPSNIIRHLIAMADDYYLFFEQRNIDWQSLKSQVLETVNDEMDDMDLALTIFSFLSAFNDAHVTAYFSSIDLLNPEPDFNYFFRTVKKEGLVAKIDHEYSENTSEQSYEDYYLDQVTAFYTNIYRYLDEDIKFAGGDNEGKIRWGTIEDNIGYLYIDELERFDPEFATDPFTEAMNPAPHVAALNLVLDQVVTDLEHTTAIILDIRMHSGGTTAQDRTIAQRFIEQEIVYGSFSASGAEPTDLVLTPYEGSRLTQPVILITSRFNQSSGEDLVMALKAEGDTIQIGEPTLGTFSDQLYLTLPNQWAFSLSNEIWLDRDGNSWEGVGLQPDHKIDIYPLSDRQQGIDSAIEKALELLQ